MFVFVSAVRCFLSRQSRKAACSRQWRGLHIRHSTVKEIIKLEDKEATRLSLGIGFIAAYSPNTSSNVWVQPFDCQPNLFGELGLWLRLQLPSKGAPIREVTCGRSHVVALTTKGEVYAAGLNIFGQCGVATSCCGEHSLTRVPDFTDRIAHIVCGLDHTLFLTESGRVLSCGWSADGQTGVSNYSSVYSPTQVHLPAGLHFSNVYTCADTSFACDRGGEVYGWGNNEYGQLGMSSKDEQLAKPVLLDLPSLDGQLVSIAAGGAFTAFLTSSGSVYTTGYSIEDPLLSHEQSTGKLLYPRHMSKLRKIHDGQTAEFITSLRAGLHYLVGEVSSRKLIVWGRYPDSGTTLQKALNTRREIMLDSHVQSIAYGPSSIAVLSSDNITNHDNNYMSFP